MKFKLHCDVFSVGRNSINCGIALGTIVDGALVWSFFHLNRPGQQPVPAINNLISATPD